MFVSAKLYFSGFRDRNGLFGFCVCVLVLRHYGHWFTSQTLFNHKLNNIDCYRDAWSIIIIAMEIMIIFILFFFLLWFSSLNLPETKKKKKIHQILWEIFADMKKIRGPYKIESEQWSYFVDINTLNIILFEKSSSICVLHGTSMHFESLITLVNASYLCVFFVLDFTLVNRLLVTTNYDIECMQMPKHIRNWRQIHSIYCKICRFLNQLKIILCVCLLSCSSRFNSIGEQARNI